MSKSVRRVEEAARQAGLVIQVKHMPEATRTAAEAAQACGCTVDRIVKSLIFEGVESGDLVLVLLNGADQLDLSQARSHFGESLRRADPKRVRAETGFAIGGVAPIGHKAPIRVWMDAHLLNHARVWAAAGAPNAVFEVAPQDLQNACDATLFRVV